MRDERRLLLVDVGRFVLPLTVMLRPHWRSPSHETRATFASGLRSLDRLVCGLS